jgi:hypothetical protein
MSQRKRQQQLPEGRYRTRVIGKETTPGGDYGTFLTLTFEVILGDYAGTVIRQRFWSRILQARAAALRPGRIVDVRVKQKLTSTGRGVSVVFDFVPAGNRTAPQAVSGIPENPAAAEEAVARAVEPGPTLVASEHVGRWEEGKTGEAMPEMVPDDLWVQLLAAIGPAALPRHEALRPLSSQRSEYDDSAYDVDEDAEDHRFVLVTEEDVDVPPECETWDAFYTRQTIVEPGVVPSTDLRVSAYEYTNDLRTYHAAHQGCMRLYSGVAWARWLTVRLVGRASLDDALEPARGLASACERVGVSREQIVVVIEAKNRAVRIHIPSSCVAAVPQIGFESVCCHFWQLIANAALVHPSRLVPGLAHFPVPADPLWYSPISRGHYRPGGMIAAVNSRDIDTGLVVVSITPEELQNLSPRDMQREVRKPRSFTWPTWRAAPIDLLSECWAYAVRIERERTTRFATPDPGTAWVYADTFRFIHDGAPCGNGEIACIRAALNLFQFGAPAALVTGLLGPGAALSGLDPEETRRLIAWAVTTHQRNGGTVPDVDADGSWDD